MTTRLVGVDPGLTTGLTNAFFDEEGKLVGFDTWQIDYLAVGDYFANISNHGPIGPIVLCEKFIINQATAKKSQAPYSLESIGVVRYFCDKAGVSLKFQTPSQVMRLITDDVLKRANMYVPGQGHSNDASRHVLGYAIMDLGIMKEALKPC